MYDENRRKPVGTYHIMTEEEIIAICLHNGYSQVQIDQRIANTAQIAESVDMTLQFDQMLFPDYRSPDYITHLYETHKEAMIEKQKN